MRNDAVDKLEPIDQSGSGDMKEQIYLLLKQKIMKREFTPNERLDAYEISRKLGISRTPVRDALNMLDAEGFVKTFSRKGTFVTGLYREDLIELFQYRQMVELFALDLGFSKLRESTDLLQAIIRKWEELTDQENYDGLHLMDVDVQFHKLIVQAAQNSRIGKSYDAMNCHVQTARGYYLQDMERIRNSDAEHKAVLAMIVQGDKQEAKRLLQLHLNNTLDSLLKLIDVFKVF